MEIVGKFDKVIELNESEERLLLDVKNLFNSKNDFGDGADFRVAFVSAIMDGYCDDCGSGGDLVCYCTRDD